MLTDNREKIFFSILLILKVGKRKSFLCFFCVRKSFVHQRNIKALDGLWINIQFISGWKMVKAGSLTPVSERLMLTLAWSTFTVVKYPREGLKDVCFKFFASDIRGYQQRFARSSFRPRNLSLRAFRVIFRNTKLTIVMVLVERVRANVLVTALKTSWTTLNWAINDWQFFCFTKKKHYELTSWLFWELKFKCELAASFMKYAKWTWERVTQAELSEFSRILFHNTSASKHGVTCIMTF